MKMNEIYLYTQFAMMVIRNRKGEATNVYISLEDVDKVQQYKWCLTSVGYAYNSHSGLLLHRYIMDAGDGYDVDHMNHNPLDNTRENLRVATRSENRANQGVALGKSGVLNVRWLPSRNYWRVEFKDNGSKTFKDFEEALEWRNKRAVELYGEYAHIQQQFEIITVGYEDMAKFESNGFHYINAEGDNYTYIISNAMRALIG